MGKRQDQAAQTRQKIIDAANKLLTEKGLERTNIREIAKEAGVGIGTFYTHFKKKEEVIEAISQDYVIEITNKSEIKGKKLYEKISNYLKDIVKIIYDSGINNCRTWFKIGFKFEDNQIVKNKIFTDLNGLEILFNSAKNSNELKEGINIQECINMIISSYYGILTLWCIDDKFNPIVLINNYCETELKAFIESITTEF